MRRPGGVPHSVAGYLFAVAFGLSPGTTAVRFLISVESGRIAAANRVALLGGLCLLDHPDDRIAIAACFSLSS